MKATDTSLSRRHFLKASVAAGGGLALYFALPGETTTNASEEKNLELLPLVTITTSGRVIIPAIMSEMGQNVFTSLPQIVADELDAHWDNVDIVPATADEKRYGFQGTWASLSVYTAWKSHRKAGATARDMLLTAAANAWGVEKSSCSTHCGIIRHAATNRSLTYGDLAEVAAKLPVPDEVPLKKPEDFHIIGISVSRRDNTDKVAGTAEFGVDVQIDGLKVAALLKPPTFGATVASFQAEQALALRGVSHVVQISSGLAVVADNYWIAEKGIQLLNVEWQSENGANLSSEKLSSELRQNLAATNRVLKKTETDQSVVTSDVTNLSADFELPLLAHTTMEPVNFTAHVKEDRCELWGPTQDRNATRAVAAEHLGFDQSAVTVNTTFLGGGFGRKADFDFVIDAIEVSQKTGLPVKVMWSRENDIKNCIFRPASAHTLSADVSKGGQVSNWQHLVAGHAAKGQEWLPTAGAEHIPYKVNGFSSQAHIMDTPFPVGTLRGIAHSSTNFANEIFIDQLADTAGQDPLEFRLAMLDHEPRAQHALKLVAEKAGWADHRKRGVFQGMALFDKPEGDVNFFNAQIVEVSKSDTGSITIDRVICAADFGQPINPDGIIAQVEGGIAYGLSMALYGEITIEDGEVQQSNFHDYQAVRMPQMPKIEVYVIENNEFPRGCGEHINPATLPAVANAVSKALGQRIRKLPLQLDI